MISYLSPNMVDHSVTGADVVKLMDFLANKLDDSGLMILEETTTGVRCVAAMTGRNLNHIVEQLNRGVMGLSPASRLMRDEFRKPI